MSYVHSMRRQLRINIGAYINVFCLICLQEMAEIMLAHSKLDI